MPRVSYTQQNFPEGLLHPCTIFRTIPRVSYTQVPCFSPKRINSPLLASPNTHYYFSFYYLNHESLLDVVPKTNSTLTKSGEQPCHAPTPDLTRCHRAHECNDANSYTQFQWFIHNYISYNSNNHVNTSISMH